MRAKSCQPRLPAVRAAAWVCLLAGFGLLVVGLIRPAATNGLMLEVVRLANNPEQKFDRGVLAEPALGVAGDLALARWYRLHGDTQRAQAALQRALQDRPAQPVVMFELAQLAQDAGQAEQAIELWRVAGTAQYWAWQAMRAADEGWRDEALALAERARRIGPQAAGAQYTLGALYFRLEDYAHVIEAMTAAIDASRGGEPWRHDALLKRGQAYVIANWSLQLADRDFREAARLRPDDPWPHIRLCEAYAGAGQLEKAQGECRAAIDLAPQSGYAYYYLGWALAQGASWKDAAAAFERAMQLEPSIEPARKWLERARANAQAEGD